MKDLGGKGSGRRDDERRVAGAAGVHDRHHRCTLCDNRGKLPASVDQEMLAHLKRLETSLKKKLGAAENRCSCPCDPSSRCRA
jgi:hypothetical protein